MKEGRNIENTEERDAFRLKMKLQLAREFYFREMPKEGIRTVLSFLDDYIRFDNPENSSIFDSKFEKLTKGGEKAMGIVEYVEKKHQARFIQQGVEKGRKEGRQEGMQAGKAEEVKNLIVKLGLSDEKVVEVAEVSVAFVKKIRASLNATK